jgi:hypothetical protein
MHKELLETQKAILSILVYFDLFNYPLSFEEIGRFLPIKSSLKELEEGLSLLVSKKSIFLIDDFYLLREDFELVERRLNGNKKAKEMMKTAEKVGLFLSQIPFIRGLAVSGSLSKDFADDHSDIDHFLITKRNRLWISRTFIFFIVRIAALRGNQDKFCLNFIVDEEEIQIRDKNIYTAMELITLARPRGEETFDRFLKANTWAGNFFPNHPFQSIKAVSIKPSFLKYGIEKILDNGLGDFLDNLFMRIHSRVWAEKHVFDKHIMKTYRKYFQDMFLAKYEEKKNELFHNLGMESLSANIYSPNKDLETYKILN